MLHEKEILKKIFEFNIYMSKKGLAKKLSDGAKFFLARKLVNAPSFNEWLLTDVDEDEKSESTLQNYIKELIDAGLIKKTYKSIIVDGRKIPNKLFIRLNMEII